MLLIDGSTSLQQLLLTACCYWPQRRDSPCGMVRTSQAPRCYYGTTLCPTLRRITTASATWSSTRRTPIATLACTLARSSCDWRWHWEECDRQRVRGREEADGRFRVEPPGSLSIGVFGEEEYTSPRTFRPSSGTGEAKINSAPHSSLPESCTNQTPIPLLPRDCCQPRPSRERKR